MADLATKHKKVSKSWKEQTLSMPDWSLLPEELLHLISTHLENCFDVIHARSVCSMWRSTFPFSSSLLRPSYSLPGLGEFHLESKDLYTLVKIPLLFFSVKTPHKAIAWTTTYFLGGIGRDDHMKLLPSPLQCSVKVEIPRSDQIWINMLDCSHSRPLGHKYRMIGCNPQYYRGVAFLPLNKDKEFIVLLNHSTNLFMLRSAEMKWMQLKKITCGPCKDLVTFRGKFYATFVNGLIFVIDPHSLEVAPLIPSRPLESIEYLVPCGNDELFLVWKSIPTSDNVSESTCRVSRLNEEARQWVEVNDLGDRVLLIGQLGDTF